MHHLKFYFFMALAVILLLLPEPITTILGLGLLGWALWRFLGWMGPVNGACRCDACRYGLSHAIGHTHISGGVSSYPVAVPQAVLQQERLRRAQATLPLIRGRGPAPLGYSYRHHNSLKGGW